MRIGFGYDIHRCVEGVPLRLGGVEIPYPKGLQGHSDGDVLLHAIGDALLGAAGLGDLGRHFPPDDPKYRGISSLALLSQIADRLGSQKLRTVHIDSTVVAEEPKLHSFIPSMRERIAERLRIDRGQINVKATTNEGVGEVGQGIAIVAYAVALVMKL